MFPGVCKGCHHREIWVDRPAARAERQAALSRETEDDHWTGSLTVPAGNPAADSFDAGNPEPRLPPWPIRRVTAGMKRCAVPEAEEINIFFGDLRSDEPDPWAEAELGLEVKTAIKEALDGATPLFLVADSDGPTPHYGRVTVTAALPAWCCGRGAARCVTRPPPPRPTIADGTPQHA